MAIFVELKLDTDKLREQIRELVREVIAEERGESLPRLNRLPVGLTSTNGPDWIVENGSQKNTTHAPAHRATNSLS